MLHCPTRKTHQSSPPADGNSRLPWSESGRHCPIKCRNMLGKHDKYRFASMPPRYSFQRVKMALYGSTTVSDTLGEGITGEGFHNASIVLGAPLEEKHCIGHVWKKWIWQKGNRKELLSHYHWGPYTYITYDVFWSGDCGLTWLVKALLEISGVHSNFPVRSVPLTEKKAKREALNKYLNAIECVWTREIDLDILHGLWSIQQCAHASAGATTILEWQSWKPCKQLRLARSF